MKKTNGGHPPNALSRRRCFALALARVVGLPWASQHAPPPVVGVVAASQRLAARPQRSRTAVFQARQYLCPAGSSTSASALCPCKHRVGSALHAQIRQQGREHASCALLPLAGRCGTTLMPRRKASFALFSAAARQEREHLVSWGQKENDHRFHHGTRLISFTLLSLLAHTLRVSSFPSVFPAAAHSLYFYLPFMLSP